MHTSFRRIPAVILAMALLLPLAARADTNKEAAILLFKEANKLRKGKKYAEALKRYRTARKLLPSFKIDYNIALTLEKMGRHVEAARAYETFLETGKGKSPAKMIELAKKKLRRLKKKIAVVKVECKVAGAVVKVDGKEAGKTPLAAVLYLEPGKHKVEVAKEGHELYSRELKLRRGQKKTVRVKLKVKKPPEAPAPVAPSWTTEEPKPKDKEPGKVVDRPDPVVVKPPPPDSPPTAPPDDPDEIGTEKSGRLFTWITLGTAGALAAAGLAVNLHAGSGYSDLEESCKPTCSDDQVDPLRTEATVSYVLFGLAGAAAVASVGLFFVEGRTERSDLDSASRSIQVSPMVGGSSYGLQGRITF